MKIIKQQNESELTIRIEGELDTEASPVAEKEIGSLKSVTKLTVDLEKLTYISSSGIRLLASLQETMDEQGSMVIIHINQDILHVFEITGLNKIFTIQ